MRCSTLAHHPLRLPRLVAQLTPGFVAQPLAKVTPKVVDDLYRYLATVGRRRPATVLRLPDDAAGGIRSSGRDRRAPRGRR